jgi:hypothetical protein
LEYKDSEKTKRNASFELVKPGAVFSFEVYFDHVTDSELKQLIWILTFGENDPAGKFCHKLGHGKPLGLGSVKICVDEIRLRSVVCDDRKIRYAETHIKANEDGFDSYLESTPFSGDDTRMVIAAAITPSERPTSGYIDELLKIANTETCKGNKVAYPMGDDGGNKPNSRAGHQWSKANRTAESRPGMNQSVIYKLPGLDESDLSLPTMRKEVSEQERR